MVKLKGPILSLDAAGTIAKTLTVQSYKGQAYMRRTPKPTDAKTGSQLAIRAMFAYLTKHWKTLSLADQNTWDETAAEKNILGFNNYVQVNLLRFSLGEAPGETYPIGKTGNQAVTGSTSAIPQGRGLLTSYNIFVLNNIQGMFLHRGTMAGFVPDLASIVTVIPTPNTGVHTYFDQPLKPARYWYRWREFTTDANLKSWGSEFDGTVS